MARALADILSELNSVYNPQRDVYNSQLNQVDPQLEAEEKGLQAAKQDEFQNITNQANRRGMFYSGLPIQEEQRYIGQSFLPGIANLKAKYATHRFGLQEALAKLTTDQANRAQDIYQTELDRDEEQRQFDMRLAAANAGGGGSGGGGSGGGGRGSGGGGYDFGGGGGELAAGVPAAATGKYIGPVQQNAYNWARGFVASKNTAAFAKTYEAIKKSASYGNVYDKYKLEALQKLAPQYFGGNGKYTRVVTPPTRAQQAASNRAYVFQKATGKKAPKGF